MPSTHDAASARTVGLSPQDPASGGSRIDTEVGSGSGSGSSSGSARLALFDLDGTLLDGDTDALWCEFLIDEGVLDRDRFAAENRRIVAGYASGAIAPDEYCAFYAATLAGCSADQWGEQRGRFIADRVLPRLGTAARALVERHRRAGDRVVLTTATNRFLTEPIAASLGIALLIATELETAHGVFTGRTRGTLNMRDGKPERLRAWLRERGADEGSMARQLNAAIFYSDSANDLPLLRAVGQAVAVDPDDVLLGVAAGSAWPVLRLER